MKNAAIYNNAISNFEESRCCKVTGNLTLCAENMRDNPLHSLFFKFIKIIGNVEFRSEAMQRNIKRTKQVLLRKLCIIQWFCVGRIVKKRQKTLHIKDVFVFILICTSESFVTIAISIQSQV